MTMEKTLGRNGVLKNVIVRGNDINMDSVGVQKYLIRGANRSGRAFPNEEWGYGTLDLYGAFEVIRPKP